MSRRSDFRPTKTLQLTAVHLRVPDLDRSVDFYVRCLGFAVVRRAGVEAELAPSPESAAILTLTEDRHAPAATPDAAGLFHAALLFPDRGALAGWLRSTAEKSVDFEGFSDHGVSEAIYLSDPDGNGLEFYADRPKTEWPYNDGEIAMTTRPLDVRGLLESAAPAAPAPLAGTQWGHLHLRITDLNRSEAYYRTTLGMDVMQRSFPGARFLAADGYHHHLGLNTWGNPRLPQPAGALGLANATFRRTGAATEISLVDPDGIHLRVQPALVTA
jgi:catechol 2,3-dioxygenase